ncbi:MAG TPA: hypothetical protein VF316_08765, partial [Polyangiaceae bacterium]
MQRTAAAHADGPGLRPPQGAAGYVFPSGIPGTTFTDGVAFVGGPTLDFRAGAVPNSTSSAGATANDLYVVAQNSKAQED